VRWTERRNIEAFLELISSGKLDVERLITHRFQIDDAERAYQLISGNVDEAYLGVILNYDPERELTRRVVLNAAAKHSADNAITLGVIGAGGYVPAMLLPHFKAIGVNFRSIATASGVSAHDVGKRFGFEFCVVECRRSP
jgi:hypothetical protein